MKKQFTLMAVLMLCIGGVGAIGYALFDQTKVDCPGITNEEIAMGRSRVGFPARDLLPNDEVADCIESTFNRTITFRERDLSPEDVVEMAAAAGWMTEAGDLADTTCFRRSKPGWQRIQLDMTNVGGPISQLSISFNPNGACRPNPT